MNRRRADIVVVGIVSAVVLGGSALSWQAYQRQRELDQTMGSMMGGSVGTMHGPNPLWYVFGTLVAAAVIGGGYLVFRSERSETLQQEDGETGASPSGTPPESESDAFEAPATDSVAPEAQPRARVLDLLPEDERRVLEPVLTSPGITQIELRDRSDFSKSKVSQTVSALEQRGLLYRERQGRTYRIYPSDDLSDR
ncbi:helix-turn-helix transcriptional regulator [Halobellus rufus]|uniref:helix-turn-helix transcriptional regulator n=1 Tax=Halobellus rufus TaxID=1448860 RepID=UPI00067938AA|nr:MarR family transcriptional regulator [Halobellus rufus]